MIQATPHLVSTRLLALAAAVAMLLALGVAHGSEQFDGLVPCALCLLERWPYRVGLLLALLAGLLPPRGGRPLLALMVLAAVAAAALGAVHVGVEQHWWPSPLPECAAPHFTTGGSFSARLASMPARPDKPCDEPTYLVPGLPVSMAQMNLLYALVLAGGISLLTLLRTRR